MESRPRVQSFKGAPQHTFALLDARVRPLNMSDNSFWLQVILLGFNYHFSSNVRKQLYAVAHQANGLYLRGYVLYQAGVPFLTDLLTDKRLSQRTETKKPVN